MGERLEYSTVDVFTPGQSSASNRYAQGNPLAIVRLPTTTSLSLEQKQLIAREFNYSETVFLHEPPLSDNSWTLDIFTTYREIPFAGHPTIGSACFILGEVAKATGKSTVQGSFHVKAGKINLTYDAVTGIARADIPHDYRVHSNVCTRQELIRLQPGLVNPPNGDSPVVAPVKGMNFILVPLGGLEQLGSVTAGPLKANISLDAGWGDFLNQYFYVDMGRNGDTVLLRVRMMSAGGWEDPATGSAACTLACYLTLRDGKAGQTIAYDVTQGVEMGRKCIIGVQVTLDSSGAIGKVLLSGTAVEVMKGNLPLPSLA
jgi:PhzF family phenazine biosynthesis protein